jgi:hypothetical protein
VSQLANIHIRLERIRPMAYHPNIFLGVAKAWNYLIKARTVCAGMARTLINGQSYTKYRASFRDYDIFWRDRKRKIVFLGPRFSMNPHIVFMFFVFNPCPSITPTSATSFDTSCAFQVRYQDRLYGSTVAQADYLQWIKRVLEKSNITTKSLIYYFRIQT